MFDAILTLQRQGAFYAAEIQRLSRVMEKIDATPPGDDPRWDRAAIIHDLEEFRGRLASINEGLAKLEAPP